MEDSKKPNKSSTKQLIVQASLFQPNQIQTSTTNSFNHHHLLSQSIPMSFTSAQSNSQQMIITPSAGPSGVPPLLHQLQLVGTAKIQRRTTGDLQCGISEQQNTVNGIVSQQPAPLFINQQGLNPASGITLTNVSSQVNISRKPIILMNSAISSKSHQASLPQQLQLVPAKQKTSNLVLHAVAFNPITSSFVNTNETQKNEQEPSFLPKPETVNSSLEQKLETNVLTPVKNHSTFTKGSNNSYKKLMKTVSSKNQVSPISVLCPPSEYVFQINQIEKKRRCKFKTFIHEALSHPTQGKVVHQIEGCKIEEFEPTSSEHLLEKDKAEKVNSIVGMSFAPKNSLVLRQNHNFPYQKKMTNSQLKLRKTAERQVIASKLFSYFNEFDGEFVTKKNNSLQRTNANVNLKKKNQTSVSSVLNDSSLNNNPSSGIISKIGEVSNIESFNAVNENLKKVKNFETSMRLFYNNEEKLIDDEKQNTEKKYEEIAKKLCLKYANILPDDLPGGIPRKLLSSWSLEEAQQWIFEVTNSVDIKEKCAKEEIDGSVLKMVSHKDLIEVLEIRYGPALKLEKALNVLKEYEIIVNEMK